MRGSVTHSVAPPKPEVGQMLNEEFVLGMFIGKGAFGTVFECQNVRTGQIFAVKRVPSRRLTSAQRDNLVREVQFLEMLNHPNIVKYVCTVKQSNHYNIVLQLMENGSLAQIMKRFGAFSPLLTSIYVRQVLSGLAYLHENDVIHRDIKGANILSDKYGRVKLADFGVAMFKQQGENAEDGSKDSHVGVGTAFWMAPEVIPVNEEQEIPSPTTAYDIWSLGCTVIELLTLQPPWSELNPNAAVTRMATQDIPIPSTFPQDVVDFLTKCFVRDPAKRASAPSLIDHPWLANTTSRMSNLAQATEQVPEIVANSPLVRRAPNKNSIISVTSSGTPPPHSLPGQIFDPTPSEIDLMTSNELLVLPQRRQSSMRRSVSNSLFPLGEHVKVHGGYPMNIGSVNELSAFNGDNHSNNLMLLSEYDTATQRMLKFSAFKEQPEDAYFSDMALPLERPPSKRSFGSENGEISAQAVKFPLQETGLIVLRAAPSVDSGTRQAQAEELVTQLLLGGKELDSTCDSLVRAFREEPELKQVLVSHPCGVSPLVEMLEANPSRAVLKLLTEVVNNDRGMQELFSMVGLVPLLTKLVGREHEMEIRRQAGAVTAHFLQTSPIALHLFVACGGVHTIAALLEAKGNGPPAVELAILAVDGVQRVFAETVAPNGSHRRASMTRAVAQASAQGGGVAKNDFCALFARTSLLDRLAALGQRLQTEEGKRECPKNLVSATGLLAEVCHVFSVFSAGSTPTKLHVSSNPRILRFILQALSSRWAAAAGSTEVVSEEDVDVDMDTCRALLTCLKNLSGEEECRDALDAAGLVQSLVPFLSVRTPPGDSALESGVGRRLRVRRQVESIAVAIPKVHNLAMVSLYSLCHGNASRQERAAVCGIVNYARLAVVDQTMVKAFALQLLVEMSHSSALARNMLFRDQAVDLFLDVLAEEDLGWRERVLGALASFVVPSSSNLEFERSMLRPVSIHRVLNLFSRSPEASHLDRVSGIVLSMMESSPRLAEAYGRTGFLPYACTEALIRSDVPNSTKLVVLRLVDVMAKAHGEPGSMLLEHNLPFVVMRLKSEVGKKEVVLEAFCGMLLTAWNKVLEL